MRQKGEGPIRLPCGVVGWSVVSDRGSSWSYSAFTRFFLYSFTLHLIFTSIMLINVLFKG